MSILSLLSLLFTLLFRLPTMIKTIVQIIALIKKMKDADFLEDIEILGEILNLILNLLPFNKSLAKESLSGLLELLKAPKASDGSSYGLDEFRDELKRKCTGLVCPADIKY